MDVVLKCGRFANVGNAAPNLKPHDSQYFGGVEQQVQLVAERNWYVDSQCWSSCSLSNFAHTYFAQLTSSLNFLSRLQ